MKTALNLGFALLLLIGIASCSDRDDENVITDISPVMIDSVQIPQDTMNLYTVQEIKVFSPYQKGCEGFWRYDYLYSAEFVRTVINHKFKTGNTCENEVITGASRINFQPMETGIYTFRFWNGFNEQQENKWIEKQIVVLP